MLGQMLRQSLIENQEKKDTKGSIEESKSRLMSDNGVNGMAAYSLGRLCAAKKEQKSG